MEEKVLDIVEQNGFSGIELGFAAVGIAAVGYTIINMAMGMRNTVKESKSFSSEVAEGIDKLRNTPEYEKVMKFYGDSSAKNKSEKKEDK
jgi:hypothetical protein